MVLYDDVTLGSAIDKYSRRTTLFLFVALISFVAGYPFDLHSSKKGLLWWTLTESVMAIILSMGSILTALIWAGVKSIASAQFDPPEDYAFESEASAKPDSQSKAKAESQSGQQRTRQKRQGSEQQQGHQQQRKSDQRQQENAQDRSGGEGTKPKKPPRAKTWNEVLGVAVDADPKTVRSAYIALIKKYHPDTVASKDAKTIKRHEEKMKSINEAYGNYRDNFL